MSYRTHSDYKAVRSAFPHKQRGARATAPSDDLRWVGWRRVRSSPYGDGTIDSAIEKQLTVHAVRGNVGGYTDQGHGQEGKAACGVKVPADNPDVIGWWQVRGGTHCKRCRKVLLRKSIRDGGVDRTTIQELNRELSRFFFGG